MTTIEIVIVSAITTLITNHFLTAKLKKENKRLKDNAANAESLLNEYTRAFRYISKTHKGLVNEAFASVNEEDKLG